MLVVVISLLWYYQCNFQSQSISTSGAFITSNSPGGFPCKRNQQTLILCLLVLLTILVGEVIEVFILLLIVSLQVVAFFATAGICKGFDYEDCRLR